MAILPRPYKPPTYDEWVERQENQATEIRDDTRDDMTPEREQPSTSCAPGCILLICAALVVLTCAVVVFATIGWLP